MEYCTCNSPLVKTEVTKTSSDNDSDTIDELSSDFEFEVHTTYDPRLKRMVIDSVFAKPKSL